MSFLLREAHDNTKCDIEKDCIARKIGSFFPRARRTDENTRVTKITYPAIMFH